MRHNLMSTAVLSICYLFTCCAAADVDRAEMLSSGCAGCHGTDGVSRGDGVPTIAGLDKRYFLRVMRQFKSDERASTIMGRLAKAYGLSDLRAMATHFSTKRWVNASAMIQPTTVAQGQRLHNKLCEDCHERGGRFQDHEVPRLAGQWPAYLYIQLLDYRDPTRRMPQPAKMRRRVEKLSEAELGALSQFYASQK